MLKIFKVRYFLFFAVLAFGAAGCGKSDEDKAPASPLTDTAGLLKFVPADTPYVFGTLAPPPDDFMDAIEPKLDRLLAAYSDMLAAAVAHGLAEAEAEGDGDAASAETINAVVAELRSLMSVQGLKDAGITRDSTAIIYGNGLLPVIRVSLSDPTLFEDTFARIEAEAGEQLPVAEVDGTPYRYVEDEDVRFIVATVGTELVLTIAPVVLDESSLARLLGLTLPAKNIAETGELHDIAEHYGYLHDYVGLVDTVRLADTFIEQPAGLDALLLEMAGYDAATLSDACKSELRSLVSVAPRMVTGYSEVSAERIRSNLVVELRGDIAPEFSTFVSTVPGLGATYDGLLSFGMSFDIEAVRSFFDKQVAALQEDPWECEHLADAQNGLFAAREKALAQPVPPVVYDFRGFLAVVNELEGFELGSKLPPESIDASFLLAIDNAQGLLAMGQAMIPQLAELAIEPDGKARQFDLPQGGADIDRAWVALTESAIALSVSEDAEAALPALLAAESKTPAPFVSADIDAAQYYSLLGEAMRTSDDEEMSEEMREVMSEVFDAAADFYDRIRVDVTFTGRGIEIDTDLALSD
jgi:hypothetical protein